MTESPVAKSANSTLGDEAVCCCSGASAACWATSASTAGASICSTSARLRGTGWWELPTKPVTDGVWRTTPHDSSVRSMRTRT
jgi:hypothetical protein